MKHTLDVTLPEGYEVDEQILTTEINSQKPMVFITTKKKNTKDFAFYVEEYLRSDYNTTNDMLCNWLDDPNIIERLKDNLKQNKLQFVPWEVEIGLVKFICKDKQVSLREYLYPKVTDVNYKTCTEMDGLFSQYFKDELLK